MSSLHRPPEIFSDHFLKLPNIGSEDVTASDVDSDIFTDCPESVQPESGSHEDPTIPLADMSKPSLVIPGMYLVLDLISEEGSGGMVDKVIIAQDTLPHFINDISPGAYTSLTKVNFAALDQFPIYPLGVYGSRSCIVSFLLQLSVIDNNMASLLLDAQTHGQLKSGLYAVLPTGGLLQTLLIYWPEQMAWDATAATNTRRNRVTFMRYLTKLADQLICFVSQEDSDSIVWTSNTPASQASGSDGEDESEERLFSFEVAKTQEQEQNVVSHPGFDIICRSLRLTSRQAPSPYPPHVPPARLVMGDSAQAILLTKYKPASENSLPFEKETWNKVRLESMLKQGKIEISPQIVEEGLKFMLECGLKERCKDYYSEYSRRNALIDKTNKEQKAQEVSMNEGQIAALEAADSRTILMQLLRLVLTHYPMLHSGLLDSYPSIGEIENQDAYLALVTHFPKFDKEISKAIPSDKLRNVSRRFAHLKRNLIVADEASRKKTDFEHPDQRADFLISCLKGDNLKSVSNQAQTTRNVVRFLPGVVIDFFSPDENKDITMAAMERDNFTSDPQFFAELDEIAQSEPLFQTAVLELKKVAIRCLTEVINRAQLILIGQLQTMRHRAMETRLDEKYSSMHQQEMAHSRHLFYADIQSATSTGASSAIFSVEELVVNVTRAYFPRTCTVTGRAIQPTSTAFEIAIIPVVTSTHDRQRLSLDSNFIPNPTEAEERLSTKFELPLHSKIVFIQLVADSKCLVITDDDCVLHVYLERMTSLPGAIKDRPPRKTLHHSKLGGDVCIAFDESKRILALCSVRCPSLVLFSFTEEFAALNSWGATIDLAPFYNDGVQIVNMCFVAGNEEILLVDHEHHVRIFSLISHQFRPGSVKLPERPSALYSSPDGACLLITLVGIEDTLYAYHWDTFGSSNEGIKLDVSNIPTDSRVLTSFEQRSNVYLLGIGIAQQRCVSVRLDITKKATNFQFLSKQRHKRTTNDIIIRNPFIDCLSEVWLRFPVIPTVTRQTTVHSVKEARRIIFVTPSHHTEFLPYFQDAIRLFEQQTKKPTGDFLSSTKIEAKDMTQFLAEIQLTPVSQFRSGEWIVDMLCLIPIHIAVTRENRFIPLQDGVISRELEQSLLGADVGRVVDSISFGWYESIFRSYLALQSVKVVSSMGEQSVGKSFALNHLADTSFAGSAMRTTEGVWMSVTPTNNTLLVALDFEGVHSIERSAQEDTLLVLFNTAISNLVLFRNNFALSRDIAGLFQSFQSSTNVLDPASNPSLFQSRLAIIIKDVVENDTNEIAQEFQLKFRKIVEEEQGANFISKLHAGQVDIIPWPVIESKKFYTLFSTIKRRLDKQPTTHTSAGEFLQVMKTLMAKLKTNDWGAMSQTMATHRAQCILSILPLALTWGQAEVSPEIEALKSLDTDIPIEGEDTDSVFILSDHTINGDQRDAHLYALQSKWSRYPERPYVDQIEWTEGLRSYISHLADLRIRYVKLWIDTNLSRFLDGQRLAVIEEVYRRWESLCMELKLSVELCKLQCSQCSLLCLRVRNHDSTLDHNCCTSHICIHACEFENCGELEVKCGYPAGHTGKHICSVGTHLCGELCRLSGKRGCLDGCVKIAGHDETEDHLCSSWLHACGEPCLLVGVPITPTRNHTCQGTCTIALDQPHDEHLCEVTSCPISCQLCQRLCSSRDHLHALQPNAIHLCGQPHPCSASCAANGICEIETAPQSIEATFTGRNETFQYTKYSQVAKRTKCVIVVSPGELEHPGFHSHSLDPDAFHFCEAQCGNCGYYCTLPLGHPQQEHETRHGSMSKTRWVVEGSDTNVIEVDGRKFSAQDDGAPMLCSLICSSLSRHIHVDYCRSDVPHTCGDLTDPDIQHIKEKMLPNPNRPKDFITHSLHWRRCGFKDPYSRDEQMNFSKCDARCSGDEHSTATAQPSFCVLPLFHPPASLDRVTGLGYASNDGHLFFCKNPVVMQQAFHVIFVIDRSSSMGLSDRRPLRGTPATRRIRGIVDNRLGAVYSSLYAFWTSRAAATNSSSSQGGGGRRDAYSVILFDRNVTHGAMNDFSSSPNELLDTLLQFQNGRGTNYTAAIQEAQQTVIEHWSTERAPVVIFLSDGECRIQDSVVAELCRTCISLGNPLSFHGVSFGTRNTVLRRMAQVARDIQNSAAPNPLLPAEARIESSYSEALDSVRLAETFLGFAESLRSARGSLMG